MCLTIHSTLKVCLTLAKPANLFQYSRGHIPANKGNLPNAVSMLVQRLRRWLNIETALGECPVFSGYTGCVYHCPPVDAWDITGVSTLSISWQAAVCSRGAVGGVQVEHSASGKLTDALQMLPPATRDTPPWCLLPQYPL